ncbi:hypothetical protein DPX16_14848 [Anabarilius grahami]|uniref:Uncharacterized protein n=1 Tax=Anabarilius grahami TaxID=495550 RepID=A0A3N0YVH1_ANAGA|nr:hypothetical protein DPX16_14848 [Anabarilius grahami]
MFLDLRVNRRQEYRVCRCARHPVDHFRTNPIVRLNMTERQRYGSPRCAGWSRLLLPPPYITIGKMQSEDDMALGLKPDAERERPAWLAAVDECGLWAFPIHLYSEGFRCSVHYRQVERRSALI